MNRLLGATVTLVAACTFGAISLLACVWGRPGVIDIKKAPQSKVPADWRNVQVEDFSFSIPPDLKAEDVRGIDSTVYAYVSDHMRIVIDLGRYSNNLQLYREQPGYREEWFIIHGRKAKVSTFYLSDEFANPGDEGRRSIAAVFFPDIGGNAAQLSFWVNCESGREQEVAKQIFYSIKFKTEIPD